MKVNKEYNNKYIIKLNNKTISKRNTKQKYNYAFVRVIKSNDNVFIFNEVNSKYDYFWDKNWINANGNFSRKNPCIFKGVQKFNNVDGVNIINLHTTNKVKEIIKKGN
jgi:hypothetical protein